MRTVGDAVWPETKEKDRPVDEVPVVFGRHLVWRVSFGLEGADGLWSAGLADMPIGILGGANAG